MTLVYELIFLVLVPASLFDLWQYRVPNALCFAACDKPYRPSGQDIGRRDFFLACRDNHSVFCQFYILRLPRIRGIR